MLIDFSILNGIDFTNSDNLLFLAVIFILAIIILAVFFAIVAKIIKVIKIFATKVLGEKIKKPKLIQEKPKVRYGVLHDDDTVGSGGGINSGPRTRIMGGDYTRNFDNSEEEPKEKNIVQSQKEKSESKIAEGLSKLKSHDTPGEQTLESKMPSRSANQPEGAGRGGIKMPTPKHF